MNTPSTILHSFAGTKLTATVDGVEYEWIGGFGAVLASHERGLRAGDTRVIGGILFYVFSVDTHRQPFWRPRVTWTVADVTVEWLREFKRALFSTQ